jgi:tellurite resistance protein TerB
MGNFLQDLRNGGASILHSVKETAARYTNERFRNGVLAICAKVAAADGTIQPQEKEKVKKLIMSNAALQHFQPSVLGAQFSDYVEKALDEFATLDLDKVIAKMRGYNDEADMAVKIGLIIANSDGKFEPSEQDCMRGIIRLVGLQAAEYGL